MKALVLSFPGSNCDLDLYRTLQREGFETELRRASEGADLNLYDLVCLPGGFSYGDYLRPGAIAAKSPILGALKQYAERGGHVLGICNGFQILCEAGLLPGALIPNTSGRFVCKNVALKVKNLKTPWTQRFEGDTVVWPIAHADGRYVPPGGIDIRPLVLFEYVENPNGSFQNIAGLTNAAGNVLGMMPHPERATHLGSLHGQWLWRSLR